MRMAMLNGLREFTKIKYWGVTRKFKDERIYYVLSAEYLGYFRELILNIVNGMVYILIPYIETKNMDLSNIATIKTFIY